MDAKKLVTDLARGAGFSAVRFTQVGERAPRAEAYLKWLEDGHHADLEYMQRSVDVRCDARERLATIQTAVALGLSYHHVAPPDPGGRTGRVARYAWGRDYHNLIGKRLRKLRRAMWAAGIDSWGGVDTPPVLERAWAEAAGLGFSGKNTLQILPGSTSWFFLAVLFIDAACEPDPPLGSHHCGRCRRCLDGCPTNAFPAPRVLDTARCISYWTIEARGLPPRDLREHFGRWVFGCDDCQDVCPHNHAPPTSLERDFQPRNAWLDLDEIVTAEDEELLARFIGTPLRRPKAAGLKRNALLALGNLRDPEGIPAARTALAHPAPVVRAAAVWALHRMGDDRVTRHRDEAPLVVEELEAI